VVVSFTGNKVNGFFIFQKLFDQRGFAYAPPAVYYDALEFIAVISFAQFFKLCFSAVKHQYHLEINKLMSLLYHVIVLVSSEFSKYAGI